MRALVAAAFLTASSTAGASEWRLIRPTSVFIDAYKYEEPRHDPYLEPVDSSLSDGATFNLDLDIAKYRGYGLYWNNQLFFDQNGETGRIAHGGWRYEVGAVLVTGDKCQPKISLFHQHESRHVFEDTRPTHFPVYDRFGVRLSVYP